MARYHLRHSSEPSIARDSLGAHIAASLYAMLHNEDLSEQEKLSAMLALSQLARDLNEHWRRSRKFYGLGSQHLWFRLCALGRDGHVPEALLRRVAEVGGRDDESHIARGEN